MLWGLFFYLCISHSYIQTNTISLVLVRRKGLEHIWKDVMRIILYLSIFHSYIQTNTISFQLYHTLFLTLSKTWHAQSEIIARIYTLKLSQVLHVAPSSRHHLVHMWRMSIIAMSYQVGQVAHVLHVFPNYFLGPIVCFIPHEHEIYSQMLVHTGDVL